MIIVIITPSPPPLPVPSRARRLHPRQGLLPGPIRRNAGPRSAARAPRRAPQRQRQGTGGEGGGRRGGWGGGCDSGGGGGEGEESSQRKGRGCELGRRPLSRTHSRLRTRPRTPACMGSHTRIRTRTRTCVIITRPTPPPSRGSRGAVARSRPRQALGGACGVVGETGAQPVAPRRCI